MASKSKNNVELVKRTKKTNKKQCGKRTEKKTQRNTQKKQQELYKYYIIGIKDEPINKNKRKCKKK